MNIAEAPSRGPPEEAPSMPGGTRRSRGSVSGGRYARPRSTRRRRLPLGSPEEAAAWSDVRDRAETLVVAGARCPAAHRAGIPARRRGSPQTTFVIGLLGAVLAIGSAMGLGLLGERGASGREPGAVARPSRSRSSSSSSGIIAVASYNAVMGLRQRIDKAWSNIDVALKQRHDNSRRWSPRCAASWRSSRTC